MAGGAWEYVTAYVDNDSTQVKTYGTGLVGKYANIYIASSQDDKVSTVDTEGTMSKANYNENLDKKGDAMIETSTSGVGSTSWGCDYSDFSFGGYPFVLRGGTFIHSSGAGVFAFSRGSGEGDGSRGFHVVLVP